MNRREFLGATAATFAGAVITRAAEESAASQPAKPFRVGMIGCDTSHCGAFTKLIHDPKTPGAAGMRVVACYPSISPDIEISAKHSEDFKKQLIEQHGVKMVDSVEKLVEQVDAVLLESVDGRRHLAEFEPLAKAGKPVYIDKPFAASLSDARAIVRLVKEHNVPCFSCSSLRYDGAFVDYLAKASEHGKIVGCDVHSPAHLEPTNPGLFWYGIHGVEILYTLMGQGCQTVRCTSTPDVDLVVGSWSDGRIATLRGLRAGHAAYGARVLAEKSVDCLNAKGDFYSRLVGQIVQFFRTGRAPMPIDETLEICAFIDAAWRSSRDNDAPIKLAMD